MVKHCNNCIRIGVCYLVLWITTNKQILRFFNDDKVSDFMHRMNSLAEICRFFKPYEFDVEEEE